jgi:hypothetical protein
LSNKVFFTAETQRRREHFPSPEGEGVGVRCFASLCLCGSFFSFTYLRSP